MKSRLLKTLLGLIIIFTSSNLLASDAEFYKNATEVAAKILGQYLDSPAKLVEQDEISCNYNILDQKGEPGKGSRVACSMYLTFYARKPHPHQGNFKQINSLADKWAFKEEYGSKVCERKFTGSGAELIRVKANYSLPDKRSQTKTLRTMAFVDFYAGVDRNGYFSFSINRSYPVTSETDEQIESRGHDLAISDSEKIIAAIRAGLSGKGIEPPRPPTPPVADKSKEWLTLSPAQIVKTHLAKLTSPVSSPIFATLAQIGNFKEVKVIEDLEIGRLQCMTAHETLYAFTSQRFNQSALIFVGIAQGKGVVFSQLSDGQITFSPEFSAQEALNEACNLAAEGLPDRWLTINNRISPQEQMVLRALSTLSMIGVSTPPKLGFSLGQIMLEMGNPVHASSIGIMPEASRNAMFATTLNRNDIAKALLKLISQRLVKRSYLAGQHFFSLTSNGVSLCRLFGADSQTILIGYQKSSVQARAKSFFTCNMAIFAQKDLAIALYMSADGQILNGIGGSIGNLRMNPAQAMLRLITNWQ